jgi:hypothetical protein
METRNSVGNEKGFILLTTYLLISVLTILSLGIFTRGSVYMQSSDRNVKKMVAFNMAEAGFDVMFTGVKSGTITASSSTPYSVSYTSLSSGSVRGGYAGAVTDKGGNIKEILVTGYSPAQSSTTEAVESRTITGYVSSSSKDAFSFGIFAKESLRINGTPDIDSYDSSIGEYGGDNVGSNGSLGTDSTTASTVDVIGNATVNGDVTTGPGSDPNSVIDVTGGATITGATGAASVAMDYPLLSSAQASSGDLSITGKTKYYLSAGTHRFDSISIGGQAELIALGPVTVYVDGPVSIAGGGVATSSNTPPNMIIVVTNDSDVSIGGNSSFYGAIYAPESDVDNRGTAEVFGGIVAKTYTQSGTADFHYDEALNHVLEVEDDGLQLLSWKESALSNS